MAETQAEQELIVYLTERSHSSDPLTPEEFAAALGDEDIARKIAALKQKARSDRQ